MREIKFRGRRPNGEWMYGALIPGEYSWWGAPSIVDKNFRYEVDPETVGQYTGCKDVTGKEIYEGDIVTMGPSAELRIIRFGEYASVSEKEKYNYGFYVEFLSKRYRDVFRKDFLFWVKHFGNWRCLVIGNTHDNPEFLEIFGGGKQ